MCVLCNSLPQLESLRSSNRFPSATLSRSIDDRNAERVAQAPRDRGDRGGGVLPAGLPRERFGRAVDAVDIMARVVKPVAHLFPRQAAALGGAAGQVRKSTRLNSSH